MLSSTTSRAAFILGGLLLAILLPTAAEATGDPTNSNDQQILNKLDQLSTGLDHLESRMKGQLQEMRKKDEVLDAKVSRFGNAIVGLTAVTTVAAHGYRAREGIVAAWSGLQELNGHVKKMFDGNL